MKSIFSGRLSPALTGRVIALIFFGWVVCAGYLVFWPKTPKPEPPAPKVADLRAPYRAKLLAVGLPDNPDFDGLPEMFAVAEIGAEWHKDRSVFSFWNPGAQRCTYVVAAFKADKGVRFKVLSSDTGRPQTAKDKLGDDWFGDSVEWLEPSEEQEGGPLQFWSPLEIPPIIQPDAALTDLLPERRAPLDTRLPIPRSQAIEPLPMDLPKSSDQRK